MTEENEGRTFFYKNEHDLGNGFMVKETGGLRPDEPRQFMLFKDGHAIGGFNSLAWQVSGEGETMNVTPSLWAHSVWGEFHGHIKNGKWVPV